MSTDASPTARDAAPSGTMPQSTRTRRLALGLVVVVGIAVGASFLLRPAGPTPSGQSPGPAAAASAPVTASALELSPNDVAIAAPQEMVRLLEITGALRAVNWSTVKARVAAELQSLDVREGDTVRAGQVLGRLDATEFSLRLRQSQEQAAQARAQLEIAERALENNRALVSQGFISQNALDTSVSNAAAARAALMAANAAADLARKAQDDTVLRAPIGGQVSQRLVQPGERVGVDARLIEIIDLSRLEIEAAVPPQDLAALRIGALATLRVDGIDAPVTARVARINPAAQAGTRAVMVYLAVAPQPGLRQGLFAQGKIELERRTVLAVPASAVRIDQARPYAIALESGQAVVRELVLGTRGQGGGAQEALVEVRSGLTAGTTVLRGGAGPVRAGTRLQLAAPVASATTNAPVSASAPLR